MAGAAKKIYGKWNKESEIKRRHKLQKIRSAEMTIGIRMSDGTVYAGISPDTHKPMFVTPADAPLAMDFNEAAQYAKDLQLGNRQDFRIPTKAELNMLFQNKEQGNLKGTFNGTGQFPDGYYWVSTPYNDVHGMFAWAQRFDDGKPGTFLKRGTASVRCVRS